MSVQGTLRVASCAATLMILGCRMGVPIHVWQPPQIESTVGQKVAVSGIGGPTEVSDQIVATLLATAPGDAGRATAIVNATTLQSVSEIQLVSATDDQPNDLAMASIARQEGIPFVLRGEILEDRSPNRDPAGEESLTVSWRLTSLAEHGGGGGKPVVVDVESAIDRYPDLGLISDRRTLLSTAVARDTFRLITPWVDRQKVRLAIPYFLPGSEEVRRGNAAALSGRWAKAEQIWNDVAEQHPSQVAAIHNLALAAAAKQDFSQAKRLARKAIRRQPSPLHKSTLVWIEVKQREYHRAFDLPDPPEGWFVTGTSSDGR